MNYESNLRRVPAETLRRMKKPSGQVLAPDRSAQCNGYVGGGFTGSPVGPAKSLRVFTGDKVYMETFAIYNQVTGSSSTILASALLSAMTSPFGIVNSGETATLYQSFNTNLPGILSGMSASTTVPKAYLVWIFFNDSYAYVNSGAQAITTSAYNAFEKLSRSFTADQNGYLYVYVANESNVSSAVNVYFDETYIVHEKNNTTLQVIQATDYYPFGLSYNEFNVDRLKETSTGVYAPELRNRYKFQGQEEQRDLDLGWYQYKWRMHDPAIGRFGAVDPLSEKYSHNSVYAFSENRLINGVELEGLEFAGTAGGFMATWESYADRNDGSYLAGAGQWMADWFTGKYVIPAYNTFSGQVEQWKDNRDYAKGHGEYAPELQEAGLDAEMVHATRQLQATTKWASGAVQTMSNVFEAEGFAIGLAQPTGSGLFSSSGNYGFSSARIGDAAKGVGKFKFPGTNPAKAPKGFEWKGKPGSTPGSKDGNWYNPKTSESLRPDLNHPDPIGPHWDYKDPTGKWWRIFQDGSNVPK